MPRRQTPPTRRLAAFLAVLLALTDAAGPGPAGPARWAGAEEPAPDRPVPARAGDAALARGLDELAQWCARHKLFGRRDEIYERLLEVEPDHAQARRWLRYEREGDGPWERRAPYRRPSNHGSKARLEEATERLAALEAAWIDARIAAAATARGLDALREAEQALADLAARFPAAATVPPALRAAQLAHYREAVAAGLPAEAQRAATGLIARWPDDLEVRTHLGEQRLGEVWVLAESARTLREASGLLTVARAALAAAAERLGPAEALPIEHKGALAALALGPPVAGPAVRAAGTAEATVLGRLAQVGEACGPLLEAALGRAVARRPNLRIYAFGRAEDTEAFLAAWPVVPNPTLAQRKTLGLSLVWADGATVVVDAVPAPVQVELCASALLNQILGDTLLGGADLSGWEAEGVVRYLAYRLTGTRHAVQVATDRYGAGRGDALGVPGSADDWLRQARDLAGRTPDLGLALLLGKGLDAFTAADSVLAYALAVYVIEGYPGLVAPFIEARRRTADPDRAAREILGMPLCVVEHRLRRWLGEVAAPAAR